MPQANPAVQDLWERLSALPLGGELVLKQLAKVPWKNLQMRAFQQGVRVMRVDVGGRVYLQMKREKERRVKESALAPLTLQDEQEHVAAAVHSYCRRRNVPIPKWSEILEIFKRLGYERVRPGDFADWIGAK